MIQDESSSGDLLVQLRQGIEALASLPPIDFDGAIDDLTVPTRAGETAARRYRPAGIPSPAPALVFFHGGGFVMGSIDSHDAVARELAASAGAAVVSVEYRLAPEHPYPAGVEDAIDATGWVAAHAADLDLDARRLGVAGDSAGAGLAAATALHARDHGSPALAFQLLVYPKLDFVGDHPSHHESTEGLLLGPEMGELFDAAYLPDRSRGAEPLASPLAAPDLAGLPPALVVSAERDMLRDEAEAYGRRLRDAGVEVATIRAVGVEHGFCNMTPFEPGARLVARAIYAGAGHRLRGGW